VYYIEGRLWEKDGVPPPLKDAGIMLLGGIFPADTDWLPGLFLYFLIGMGMCVFVCVCCWGRSRWLVGSA
jgi:hypothetical protein